MIKYALVALLIVAVVYFVPVMLIWSLNTLFPVLEIPYTFETWAATAILLSVFSYESSYELNYELKGK